MQDGKPSISADLQARRDSLLAILRSMESAAVAMSGGVDSTVVAAAAQQALGGRSVAVTADSPSVARADLADARRLAKHIGIRHIVVSTTEFANADYLRNDGSRCYFCKSELYRAIEQLLPELGVRFVCSGANVDDLGDYRPGLRAAAEHGVRHPLQEAGMSKADVRLLARHWRLPNWDKPATPCLSSRLAPGVPVTAERTGRIEAAEAFLREFGLREFRVRLHEGELARIELPLDQLPQYVQPGVREKIGAKLRSLGFRFVTVDLEGFRSGSLNDLIDLETKKRFASAEKTP